jgi:hypothetical protein
MHQSPTGTGRRQNRLTFLGQKRFALSVAAELCDIERVWSPSPNTMPTTYFSHLSKKLLTTVAWKA